MNANSELLSHSAMPPGHDCLRILLRREWNDAAAFYRTFALLWIIGLWILPVLGHPLFVLWSGLILVFLLTPAQAGVDVLDGTEEFTFSQPPTRAEVFLSRILPGAIFLVVTGVVGVLAIGFDLPQKFWSIFFSGGLTQPFRPVKEVYWYPLAVLLPLAAHAIAGGFAALAITRQQVLWAGIFGVLGAWAIAGGALAIEQGLANRLNGWVSAPALVAAIAGVSMFAFRAYQAKEATRAGAGAASLPVRRRGGWGWFLVALIVLLLVLSIPFFRVREVGKEEAIRTNESLRIEKNGRIVPGAPDSH